ncbi:MAG: 30S ribosomal protein S6 [Bacteroidota bacterium]|nr:30S ribosomal protein S6 [Bacteroidota bacterium]
MNQQKQTYETTFIVNASLEDPQVETIITHASETITRNGGEIKQIDKWGRRRLAYPILKKNNGFYVNIEFTSSGELIPQLERSFLLDENILRFLTIHLDEKALKSSRIVPVIPTVDVVIDVDPVTREPIFEDDDIPITGGSVS